MPGAEAGGVFGHLSEALWATPPNLSPESRYTAWNGCLYPAGGALLVLWPGAPRRCSGSGHSSATSRGSCERSS